VIYRRRDSPLHSARAGVAMAWCFCLALLCVATEHPLVLAAALVSIVVAGRLAGVGAELARVARFAVPLAVLVAAINPFVVREGLTVIARLGELGPLGRLDITLEATVYGGILGLRALVIMLAFGLYSAAIDPDEVLRLFRRISFRSALTASIATRLLPVLTRDARSLGDAQRCRPGPAPARLAIVRAVAAGSLDRAVDVAAALEVRGYGVAERPPRRRRAWSRHDIAFTASTAALVALMAGARIAGVAGFDAYPRLVVPFGASELVLAVATVACALAPFADRRGVAR
jgi:energy-coupling factor transport system permease protein